MIELDEKKFAHQSSKSYVDGEIIFSEGDDSREMYIVQSGEVVVSKMSKKGEVILATLRKGDFVGEMSLLESLPRSATARAHGKNVKLLAIHPGGFLVKIRRDPTFAYEMLQALSRRIRITNDNLMRELSHDKATNESLKAILNGSEFNAEAAPVSDIPVLRPAADVPKVRSS